MIEKKQVSWEAKGEISVGTDSLRSGKAKYFFSDGGARIAVIPVINSLARVLLPGR